MILRELFAKLGLEVDKEGFKAADNAIGGLKVGLLGVAAAATAVAATLTAMVHGTVEAASQIKDMADRTGESTDTIQGLKYAAEQTGTSLEGVVTGLKFLQKNAFEAANGSEEMQKAFREAGISVKDSNGHLKTGSALMQELSDTLRKTSDPAKRTALAMKLMGRSGSELIPTLTDAESSLSDFINRAQELGAMSEETVNDGERLGDTFNELKTAWEGVRNAIVRPLLKPLIKLFKLVVEGAILFRENLRFIGVAAGIAAGAFIALNAAAVAAAVATAAAWLAALWPLWLAIAVIALVALAIEDLWTFLEGGDSVIGRLMPKFKELWQSFNAAVEGTIAEIMGMFGRFWDWMVEKALSIGKAVKDGVMDALKAGLANSGLGVAFDKIGGMFGGGESPAASVASAPAKTNLIAPQNKVQINVETTPGMSSEEVGAAVQQSFADYNQRMVREAIAGVGQ